jgi:hypothetical protein
LLAGLNGSCHCVELRALLILEQLTRGVSARSGSLQRINTGIKHVKGGFGRLGPSLLKLLELVHLVGLILERVVLLLKDAKSDHFSAVQNLYVIKGGLALGLKDLTEERDVGSRSVKVV